jgi:hypothetical protein
MGQVVGYLPGLKPVPWLLPGGGAALASVPLRVASGYADPFYPGVRTLASALPKDPGGVPAELYFGSGCHTGSFFNAQEPPSLAFLARHLG